MQELKPKEKQWLRIFAEDNKTYALMREFYDENNHLKDDDYSRLKSNINDAQERGWRLLSLEATNILREFARANKKMLDLMESYEKKGYLDDAEYELFKWEIEEDGQYEYLLDDDDNDD